MTNVAYQSSCPSCSTEFTYDAAHMGSISECNSCGSHITLPAAELPKGYDVGGFVIEELLGEGSMGLVYKALQKSMNRTVALKIIKPEITANEENITDFFREIQLLASFNHPNVVLAIEAGTQGNLYFLAMQYIEGQALDEPILEGQIFSEEETLSYCSSVAEALQFAWDERQMIHCDIKPANIMLDKKKSPKLMDLGISKCSHEQSAGGVIVGTPFFMSPEQAQGKKLDFRSDIFSLGATMYNMLTGQYPFPGVDPTDPMQVIEAVKNDPLNMDLLKENNVSKATAELIKKMCTKSYVLRHKSWDDCIEQFQASFQKLTQPQSAPKKAGVKLKGAPVVRRRRKQKKSIVPLVLLVLLGVGFYCAYKYDALGLIKKEVDTWKADKDAPQKNIAETAEP